VGLGQNSTTESDNQYLMPVTKTFTTFWCRQDVISGGGSVTFTVRINGASTSTTCGLSGAGGPTSVSGTYALTAGDLVDVQVSSNNTTARRVYWGLAP